MEEVRAINLNHRHQHKHRHMKKDDEDKEEKAAKPDDHDHPPKEVSHYTQEMVKEDIKKHWYEDHAFNVTDLAYNSGDARPKEHSNGFTNAQKNSSKNGTLSLAQYGPLVAPGPEQGETNYRDHFHGGFVLEGKKPSSKCWGNCNGSGAEKQDDFWDMGHASTSAEQFWGFTKKSKMGSHNTFDTEPTGHPMGTAVMQKSAPNSLVQASYGPLVAPGPT